MIEHTEDCSSS